jgi:hypothetical protein
MILPTGLRSTPITSPISSPTPKIEESSYYSPLQQISYILHPLGPLPPPPYLWYATSSRITDRPTRASHVVSGDQEGRRRWTTLGRGRQSSRGIVGAHGGRWLTIWGLGQRDGWNQHFPILSGTGKMGMRNRSC